MDDFDQYCIYSRFHLRITDISVKSFKLSKLYSWYTNSHNLIPNAARNYAFGNNANRNASPLAKEQETFAEIAFIMGKTPPNLTCRRQWGFAPLN